jgi:NAD(P)H-dependent flavin oxidoreductase YrpB (nitropropane dioxygenase family)
MMIRTKFCELLGVEYPVALGGMGGGFTQPDMVAAVSDAGGFGALSCNRMSPEQIHDAAATVRSHTDKPYALNFLLFLTDDECYAAALEEKPAAIALAWPRREQDLKSFIDRAHDAGCKVTLMAVPLPTPNAVLRPVPTLSLRKERKAAATSDGWPRWC